MKTRPWISVTELDNSNSIDAVDAVQAASFVLFQLSGQKYAGIQRVTEQYFCETSGAPVGCMWDSGARAWWNPHIGAWAHPRADISGSRNRLRPGNRIRLNYRPVREIESVSVGGIEVDSSGYHLLNGEILARGGHWGLCDGPVITYTYGTPPPALGRMAARRLANELVLAASGSDNCALPTGVTSVSRQGLTMEIFDPQDFMDKGHTGLYEVDLFLAAVNPAKAKKRPRVFSTEMRRGYRRS